MEKYSYNSFANMEEDRLMFKMLLLLKKKFHVLCTTNRRITLQELKQIEKLYLFACSKS